MHRAEAAMTILRGIAAALGAIRPLEMSLVALNLCLIALMWNLFVSVTNARSINLERYVAADLVTDQVLSNCIVEGYR
jgi:hypothetical protein